MAERSISHGTVLGDRYRLEDLLSDQGGARFWRAWDSVLERNVAIHSVASDDPRAARVLTAAQRSAGVTEPHFLRVLDCAESDGLTWVVNEWGDGLSLDLMLDQGPLQPQRAAWLAREVAVAIAAAHARDRYHGHLNPESVLVTPAGAVKVIGFVVNAAFRSGPRSTGPYGSLSDREADVIDLAGILYAALTGRWPGVSSSHVPAAPRTDGHPLRPRQVRAGVPRTLDAICERVLHKEGTRHILPIETAHEIAAALSDFVGDPVAALPAAVREDPDFWDEPGDDVEDTGVVDVRPTPAQTEEPEQPPAPEPWVDPEATMASPDPFALPYATSPADPEPWEQPPPDPTPGQPDDVGRSEPTRAIPRGDPADPPVSRDRPLFAEERRVPPGAPGGDATSEGAGSAPERQRSGVTGPDAQQAPQVHRPPLLRPDEGQGPAGGRGRGHRRDQPPAEGALWPFEPDPEDGTRGGDGTEGRSWLRLAAVVIGIVALLVAVFYVVNRPDSEEPAAGPTVAPTEATPTLTGEVVRIVAAHDFDPEGDPPEEHPDQAAFAIDGKPGTGWRTLTYRGNPRLGGLKSGVGLILDLGTDVAVGSVEISLAGSPSTLELHVTPPGIDDQPTELADTSRVAAMTVDGDSAVFRLSTPQKTRFVVLWFTELPEVSGGYRGEITEVTVRTAPSE